MMNSSPRPVLTAVSVVCHKYFPKPLPRLAFRIDSFIDTFSHQGALVKACERGDSAQSLQYFFAREDSISWCDAVEKAVSHGFTHVLQWMAGLPVAQGPWAADFENTIEVAAEGGHLETIQWLHDHYKVKYSTRAMTSAARNGYLDVVQWLFANSTEGCTSDTANAAASNGHLEVLDWLCNLRGETCTKAGVTSAADRGHLEVVKWLSEHARDEFDSSVMDSAARNGHLSVVKWLHENIPEGCTTAAMDEAAGNGHLAVVEWLHQNREEGCTTGAMDKASAKGYLDVVKFLHVNRREGCTTSAMDMATWGGYVDVVQWLKENRTEGWSEDFRDEGISSVAYKGHLEMLKWLHTNLPNATWTLEVMDTAARNGYIEIVKWLHKNREEGCSTEAMDKAASENHLEVLKWLHSNRKEGCTASAIDYAAANGNLEIAKWLHENCHKGCTVEAFTLAAKYDKAEMLQWLYETQPREAAATPKYAIAMLASMAACYRPCPRVVKWLFENGEPTSGIVEGTAVGKYNLELIQWLVKRRPSFNTPKAVRIAAQNRNVACMRWLLEQFGKLDEDLVVDLVGEFGYTEVLALQAERVRVASLASAVRNGKFDVVKQLFKGDHERFADTQRVIREAVQSDQENIVQWLRQEVNLEDRYTWDFGPTIGRTRNRDDDTPEGRQIMSAILRKHPHFM